MKCINNGEIRKINNNQDGLSRYCNNLGIIQHICNRCINRRPKYTKRHNDVQNIIKNLLINEDRNRIIYSNQTIKSSNNEILRGEVNKLKPDLW